MKNLEKFLEFNGKRISVLLADGTWWVAVKPICEALAVQYEAQRIRISEHPILSQLPRKHMVVAADRKTREMLCLPEKFIYGWLFSINSDNAQLLEFQRECYEVLYNHFHGAMTARFNVLNERDSIALRILELEDKLEESAEYQEILELRKRKSDTTKALRRLDVELKTGQLSMEFKTEESQL